MKTTGWAVALLFATAVSAETLHLNGIGVCKAGVVTPLPDGTKCTYSYKLGNFVCEVINNNCVLELPGAVEPFDKTSFCCGTSIAGADALGLRVASVGAPQPPREVRSLSKMSTSAPEPTTIKLEGIIAQPRNAAGGMVSVPAADGTRVIILYDKKEYTCMVEKGACIVTLPTYDPNPKWSVLRVEWLFGVGYTSIVE